MALSVWLFRFVAARFANAIDIQALASPRESCRGCDSRDHFSRVRIIYIPNAATAQANQVYVRFHVGIKPCLTLWEIQFLDQAQLRQDLKRLVHCCKADCWMNLFDFFIDSLHTRMFSTRESKPANRYPLRGSLVSLPAKRLNYRRVRFFGVAHWFY
jgi:hypothetical protein